MAGIPELPHWNIGQNMLVWFPSVRLITNTQKIFIRLFLGLENFKQIKEQI
jgi:hypothetical protein